MSLRHSFTGRHADVFTKKKEERRKKGEENTQAVPIQTGVSILACKKWSMSIAREVAAMISRRGHF